MSQPLEAFIQDNPAASPLLSVVMPVHNAMPFLEASVQSILQQTFAHFEFVILNNGSNDGSSALLRRCAEQDRRIRLVETAERLGLVGSSNAVVRLAQTPLIARMDADDIAHPERLQRQWEAMRRPEVVAVGTLFDGIDRHGTYVRPRDRWRLVGRSMFVPFHHGSTMFRRTIFEAIGCYRLACEGWEEQDLFSRMAAYGEVLVLPDVLHHYRHHLDASTFRFEPFDAARMRYLMWRCLQERQRGQDYTHLLELPPVAVVPNEFTVYSLYLEGARRLWAGLPPQILRSLLRRDVWSWSYTMLRTLIWATWASISPTTLRWFLCGIIRGRDWLASVVVHDGKLYPWRY